MLSFKMWHNSLNKISERVIRVSAEIFHCSTSYFSEAKAAIDRLLSRRQTCEVHPLHHF